MKRSLLFLLSLATLSGTSFGGQTVLEMQDLLERRITPVAREVDPKALVFVRIRFKDHPADRVVAPYSLRDTDGEAMEIERVGVTVFSDVKTYPGTFKLFVQELTGQFGDVTTVKVKPLPKDFIEKKAWLEKKREIAAEVAKEKAEREQEIRERAKRELASATAKATPAKESLLQRMADQLSGAPAFQWVIMAMGVLLIFTGLLVGLILKQGTRRLHGTLSSGLDRLTSALERGIPMVGAGSGGGSGAMLDPVEVLTELTMPQITAGASSAISGLSDNAFAAILADCYWGEFDCYAAYIWNRIPLSRRGIILAKQDFLASYASHLVREKEINYGAEQEAYYVAPLEIGHLCNTRLTELVRQYPSLLFKLPHLRLAGLHMEASERIELTKRAHTDPSADLFDFSAVEPSPLRQFAPRTLIQLRNEEEEMAVLENRDLSLEIIQDIPSLGWLMRLGDEQITAILSRFSAQELASAWVGPMDVLGRLERCLPARKLRLLMACEARFGSSRQSPAFLAIHQLAMEQLKASQFRPENYSNVVDITHYKLAA